ncbi:MAG: hypothetical protein ACO1N0_16860 [Fluviicola sp.]
MEMHALIEEITALLAKIKSGEAALGELEAFAAATGQLNERAIILRYKAIESKVYGSDSYREPVAPEVVSESPALVVEEIAPMIEAREVHTQEPEEPSFDLFGIDSEMDEEEEGMLPNTEILSDFDEESSEEAEEEIPFEMVEEHADEVIYEEPIAEVVEPVNEMEEEIPVKEPAFAAPIENTQGLHPIYGKLNSNDGTLAARLMSVRLETLKGAFGFNERLQIIQELFNGSNDEFNGLIDQIETISSKEQARSLVSSYANKYHWDVESQLAIELVQKVERKYA